MSNKKLLLEWESFPFMEYPKKSFLLVVFLILFFTYLYHLTVRLWDMPIFYIVGVLILIGALLPYFVSAKYQLFDSSIRVTYLFFKAERKYSEFRCYYADKNGVMLGTFVMPRWLDNFRGLSLRFSKSREEKTRLLEILEEKVGNRK
jgi:hypothetical protein